MKEGIAALIIGIITLLVIEGISFLSLKISGDPATFLYASAASGVARAPEGAEDPNTTPGGFLGIDPHLGFGHAEKEEAVKRIKASYRWIDGSIAYSTDAVLQHPVVLTLGGSTTDGLMYSHSWPEELAKVFQSNNKKVTVVNAGTGGYSTNQELLKLVRDGLAFEPDFVVSYSAYNDRGYWGNLPHPMVHPYQKRFLRNILYGDQDGSSFSGLMPSTVSAAKKIIRSIKSRGSASMDLVLGVPIQGSLAKNYEKNMVLMNAISQASGARFEAFIQPYALYRSKHASAVPAILLPGHKEEKEAITALYDEIRTLPQRHAFIHDATGILEREQKPFKEDGVHLTEEGDRAIALYVYNFLAPLIK